MQLPIFKPGSSAVQQVRKVRGEHEENISRTSGEPGCYRWRERGKSEGGRGEEREQRADRRTDRPATARVSVRERDEREGEMKGVKEEDLKEAAKTQKIL